MKKIEANYTNCGIILLGDYNKLDFKCDAKCFQLKTIVVSKYIRMTVHG